MANNKVEIKIDVNTNTKTLEELNEKLGETSAEAKKLGKATEIHASFNGKEIAVAKAEFDELIKKATATGKALDIKAKVDGSGNISMLASDFDELKVKAEEASNGVSSFSDRVKSVAVAAGGLYVVHEAFGAVANGAKKAIEVTAQFETFEATLKTITGSSTEAKKAMAWIEEFAAKTPYELKEVTAAFVKLKSYGIDPIKGDTLKTLGDTASAMGKTLDQAVEAMADAMTGEYERLKEFGIKSSSEGEKVKFAWATSSGELREITVKNNADIIQGTLKAIWNEKYKGAMDERSNTYAGLASNMADSFNKALKSIAEESGAFEGIKYAIKEVSGYLSKITKEDVRDFISNIKSAAKEVGFFVAAFVTIKSMMWLSTITSTLGTMLSTLKLMTIAQTAFNIAAKANPYMIIAGAIASVAGLFGFFGDEAEKAGDKAKDALDKTSAAAKEAEEDTKTAAIGKSKAEAEAAEEIEKKAKELKDKLKGYSEERRLSHEKTLEGLKKKELELKDAIEKANKELAASLKRLETERIERQRDLSVKVREIDRGMMDNAKAYMDRLKQSDEEYYLAKEALKKKDLETYKKHMAEYLRLATDGAGKAVEVEGKVIYTKEQTATVAKEAIKKTQALENEYYALKKAQEIAAHNQKIELIQAELSATKTKIQAELAQLAILSKIYEALTGKSIDIKIDTAQGQAALTALDTQYKNLENQKIKIDLDTAKAESAIKKTEAAAKKGATIDIEADTDKANKDLKSLKEENSSIVIEIQGEAEALKKDIESFKQPTESKHTITGQVKNKSDLDALKKDTNSTHTVYVKTVQTRQSGGEIFDIGRARGLESGGALSGYGGGDTVPAMLEPGEFVVRKEAVARYGFTLMHNLNSLSLEPQIRKYAVGGLVLGEADSAFIKDKANSNSSSSSSYSSSSDPVEVKLTLANPPFNASVPDYQALVSELAKLSSTITQLKPSGSDFMSLETADKITKLEAEQTAIKETYKTNENNFRKTLKEQSKQYVTSLKASQSQIGSSVVNIPQINPAATGEDDEVQGYVDDAKDAYQDALENARDAIMNMVEPYTKYGATGPDISGIMDLGTLSRKALEVKQKVDSLKGRDFSVLEDRQGFIQKYIYEHSPNPYDMTVHYLPSNAYDYQTRAYGRQLTPFEAADMQATANAAQLKAALRFQVGGDVPNLSSGAKLSGYGGGDIVPAYLEPGEFVVRKEATSHYGSDVLHAINNLSFKTPSVLKFQSGGVVPGTSSANRITKDVNINIKGDRGENMQLLGDDATAKALESYLRRRV